MKALLNWRTIVLIALSSIACFFLLCEAETIGLFLLSKVIGAGVAFVIYVICNVWNMQGKLEYLKEFVNDEC